MSQIGSLGELESGDQHASADLLPLVYAKLRRLAGGRMASQSPDHTLQATASVHESYVRLVETHAEGTGEQIDQSAA